jgi:hypothetical protein
LIWEGPIPTGQYKSEYYDLLAFSFWITYRVFSFYSVCKLCKASFLNIHFHDAQGFPSDNSDNEWDNAITRQYGRGHEDGHARDFQDMDVDVNVIEAVQHAFHVYDSLEVAEDGIDHDDLNGDARDKIAGEGSEMRPIHADEGEVLDAQYVDGDVPNVGGHATNAASSTTHAVLKDNATTPLFAEVQLSCLTSTLLILNCLRIHGASNALISELFMLLSKSVLPPINCLSTNKYMASKMLSKLGLAYELIHACPDRCMLFRSLGSEHIMSCLKCQKPKFKRVEKSLVLVKVLCYFPLILRLKRVYSTPVMAELMTWHRQSRSTYELIRHVVDSLQWKWVEQQFPNFANEDRNIRLAMATDGINPYGVKRSNWSAWPICLLNYNVPSWLTTKKHFIILSMIIPRKESVTCETFDVYLQPCNSCRRAT